jgi:hypothetical protein
MIRKIAEPARLILAWQAPDQFGPENRTRWAVGLVERQGVDVSFRYLGPDEFLTLNQGRSISQLTGFGYRGYPAFRPWEGGAVFRSGVLAAFLRRLPPRSRPDFQSYLRSFRVASTDGLSDFALLGVTEAKLPSDGFSLVDPLDPELVQCDLMLEVAGYRYYAPKLRRPLSLGDEVQILEDPDKTYEPHAVAAYAGGEKIGNINRLQAPTFISWLGRRKIWSTIERLNGTIESPKVHLYVEVRPLVDTPELRSRVGLSGPTPHFL